MTDSIILPSPSSNLFERSIGALISNFNDTLETKDQHNPNFLTSPNILNHGLLSASMETTPTLTASTPEINASRASMGADALFDLGGNTDYQNMNGYYPTELSTNEVSNGDFKNPAYNYIVGSFLDNMESISAANKPPSSSIVYHDNMLLLNYDENSGANGASGMMGMETRSEHGSPALSAMSIGMIGESPNLMAQQPNYFLQQQQQKFNQMQKQFSNLNNLPTPSTSPYLSASVVDNFSLSPNMRPTQVRNPYGRPRSISEPKAKKVKSGKINIVPTVSLNGEITFNCTFIDCDSTYSTHDALQAHLSTHATAKKEKPFKCEICPQTFSRSHDLKRHYYIHSQEKPYSCDRCGKGFARRDALRRHEKSVLEGRKVHCVPL